MVAGVAGSRIAGDESKLSVYRALPPPPDEDYRPLFRELALSRFPLRSSEIAAPKPENRRYFASAINNLSQEWRRGNPPNYPSATFALVRHCIHKARFRGHLSLPPSFLARPRPVQFGATARARDRAVNGAMARKINRLNARAVATITKHGRHADGGGLYLSISPNGGRRWVFLFRWHGKATEIGFGSARDVTLARARELASQARAKLAEGINPKDARRPLVGATFGECADRVIEAMRPSWRNGKHAAQWEMTLRDYAAPIRGLPVDKVITNDVLSVLKPIWSEKPETASRLRGRIERVLDAAKAQGLRNGENPARWRGHLDQLLPKRQRLTRGHHAAMSYVDLPTFMSDLRARTATAALALEFAILTAARSGEVLGARWDEFDFDRAVWTVPAARMKAGREHRVPLSKRALKIVKAQHEARDNDFVFAGQKPDKPLSVMALEMVLRRMKIQAVTVHGFRSGFRDWAAECTNFTNEVCEAALAHVIENKAEAAYRRGDLFDKRRKLMEAWAIYCTAPKTGKVVTFRGRSEAR
jgi:integrase